MDDLIADFVAECREMLEALGGEIVAWEANPDDRARLDSIFRFVHTVKGNCGFFDFPRLEALSHAAEDALADCRAGRRVAGWCAGQRGARGHRPHRRDDRRDRCRRGTAVRRRQRADRRACARAPKARRRRPSAAVVADNGAKGSDATPRTIRLSVELLDRVMSGVSDMVLARNELARRLREAPGDVAVDGAFERLSGIIAEMRDAITRTRMQRIENLFVALPRMVRDLSAELGKQVLVDIDGGDVELDREMIEMIRDPLTHIIRNAVDHGIETPAERLKAGKREIGLLSVSARQSGNQILIDIADDGKGIDGSKLVEKALANGVIERDVAQRLSKREQLALIFEAGLSTAKEVTAISGRGVGMDVVRSNVERIGGVVEVDSAARQGHADDASRAADADDHPGADRIDRQAAFRHSALGDRRDRPCQWQQRHPGNDRRGRGRDDSRPPRAGSRAGRRARPSEHHARRGAHAGRAAAGRWRRLCAGRRPDPRP